MLLWGSCLSISGKCSVALVLKGLSQWLGTLGVFCEHRELVEIAECQRGPSGTLWCRADCAQVRVIAKKVRVQAQDGPGAGLCVFN
jgi:hypothetical protein